MIFFFVFECGLAITADIEKAFVMIHVAEADQDALRFYGMRMFFLTNLKFKYMFSDVCLGWPLVHCHNCTAFSHF